MNIKAEILLSLLSATIGVIGGWLTFSQFQHEVRERQFAERRAALLVEEKVKALNEVCIQLKDMLHRMDERHDELEVNLNQVQGMVQVLMGQRDK